MNIGRTLFSALVILFACSAAAQQPAAPAPDDAAAEAARRADVANMQPAVNVGAAPRTRPAVGGPSASVARARDTVDLGTTSITGNQELPKVLYIVPWKKSDLGDLVGRPANTLLDEVLAPIDPEEFERHLNYYQILYGDSSSSVTAAGRSEEE